MMRALTGIEHLTLEDRAATLNAIDSFAAGLDFADALHLARSGRAAGFTTFDRKLAGKARKLGLVPTVDLLS